MFAGIGRSLIPILTPEYVVNETVKAVLVNQEVLYLPSIVYMLVAMKQIFPPMSFLWAHRAIGCASTMKHFTGRTGPNSPQNQMLLDKGTKEGVLNNNICIKMDSSDIGITIPSEPPTKTQLNQ